MKNIIHFMTLIVITFNISVNAWVYPEHREIAIQAVELLSPYYRTILDNLWVEARIGNESRLSETVIDPLPMSDPSSIDYAAWTAIAGDHSCSSENMLETILHSEWILDIAKINAQLKIALAVANTREKIINTLRDSDLKLQKADPGYATRAGSNNSHFLLPLQDVNMDIQTYIDSCLAEGVEINSIGVYYLYHISALNKASKIFSDNLTPSERSKLILSALADEAFAQHFIEDMFAAGHAAGTWGDVSQRKGTHDYYNEHGLKIMTWRGEKTVLMGDAWMRDEDGHRAAKVLSASLKQILDAAVGKLILNFRDVEQETSPSDFNVCKTNVMPDLEIDPSVMAEIEKVIIDTPVPGLTKGLGDLPRFRAELGPFIGFSPSLRGSMIFGGLGETENKSGFSGGLAVALRFGVGLDGVLNESGDGLVFLEIGWREDGASTTGFVDEPGVEQFGNITAAIPGRSSYSARLRLPFYIVPLDLLIAGPFLLLFDSEALTNMGTTAVNGGLIPWQAGIATSFGRFQFILGREMSVYFFGRGEQRDALMTYGTLTSGEQNLFVVSYQSTQFEFPILEYRPFRSFSDDQSSSMLVQIYGGVDIPYNITTLIPIDGPAISLQNVWFLGARLVFDWRHYF